MTPFKKRASYFLAALFLATPMEAVIISHAQASEENLDTYKDFVKEVSAKITDLFADKNRAVSSRKQDFQVILENHFNIEAIGKFVLGRYWRTADEGQKQKYLDLFKKALVDNYSKHFNDYHNEKLEVISARRSEKNKGIIVQTKLKRPQEGEDLIVDWTVFNMKGQMKVFDLTINGVSQSISLRDTYGDLYQTKGNGTMDGFLQALAQENLNH